MANYFSDTLNVIDLEAVKPGGAGERSNQSRPPAVPSPLPSDGRGEFPSPAGAGEGGALAPGEGRRESTSPCGQGEVRVLPSLDVGCWKLDVPTVHGEG